MSQGAWVFALLCPSSLVSLSHNDSRHSVHQTESIVFSGSHLRIFNIRHLLNTARSHLRTATALLNTLQHCTCSAIYLTVILGEHQWYKFCTMCLFIMDIYHPSPHLSHSNSWSFSFFFLQGNDTWSYFPQNCHLWHHLLFLSQPLQLPIHTMLLMPSLLSHTKYISQARI